MGLAKICISRIVYSRYFLALPSLLENGSVNNYFHAFYSTLLPWLNFHKYKRQLQNSANIKMVLILDNMDLI